MTTQPEDRVAVDPEALKGLRSRLGLTQRSVATCSGLTESAYRSYELGDRSPSLKDAEAIARVLGAPFEMLLDHTPISITAAAASLMRMEELGYLTIFQDDFSTINLMATSNALARELRAIRRLAADDGST